MSSKLPSDRDPPGFLRKRHIGYFKANLSMLPSPYAGSEHNRLTLLYFCLASLDLLGELDGVVDRPGVVGLMMRLRSKDGGGTEAKSQAPQDLSLRKQITEWIYSLQILSQDGKDASHCGFRGSPCLGARICEHDTSSPDMQKTVCGCGQQRVVPDGVSMSGGVWAHLNSTHWGARDRNSQYDCAHITMTYAALCCLLILGDDLGRVDRRGVLAGIRSLQDSRGAFCPTVYSRGESDLRFSFCACAISFMLNDFSAIHVGKLLSFVRSCLAFDGAFSLRPDGEGHGGSTYCAVAILKLLEYGQVRLDGRAVGMNMLNEWGLRARLVRWCVNAQCCHLTEWSGSFDRSKYIDCEQKTASGGQNDGADSSATGDNGGGNGGGDGGVGGRNEDGVASDETAGESGSKGTQPCVTHGEWCPDLYGGFKGRPNKPPDCCYSFWIGCTLSLLGYYDGMTHPARNLVFSVACQTKYGGFGKLPGRRPDLLHSFTATAGLCLMSGNHTSLTTTDDSPSTKTQTGGTGGAEQNTELQSSSRRDDTQTVPFASLDCALGIRSALVQKLMQQRKQ